MARNVGFGRFATRRQGPRRESLWIDASTAESVLTGAPTAVLTNSLSAAGLALLPFTVVRVRGFIHIRSDQAAASETFMGDLGMAIVSAQAEAIGITAIPTPLTDKDSDLWFVHQMVADRIDVGSGAGTGPPVNTGKYIQYDSKAMRKVVDGDQLVVVVENELAGCNLTHSARLLLKLH